MTSNETTDCTLEQWQSEIMRQYNAGELVVVVRSSLGGLFPLGKLPNDPGAENLEIIAAVNPISEMGIQK